VRSLHSRIRGKGPRRAAVALGYLLLALAVVCGIAQSGSRYFYCEALGLMPSDPCVQAAHGGDTSGCGDILGEKLADCCEVVTLPAMPDGARAASPTVLPAALVAIVPSGWLADLQATLALRAPERFSERWRPPPRSAGEVCARLMVFLT
jgi:hypothetical protein